MTHFMDLCIINVSVPMYIYIILFMLVLCLLLNVVSLLFRFIFLNKINSVYYFVSNFVKMLVLFILLTCLMLIYNLSFFYLNVIPAGVNSAFFDAYFKKHNGVFFYFNYFFYSFNIDFFGFMILFLAYIIGFLCIVCLNSRYYTHTENIYILFILFLIVVHLLVCTTNYVFWVILYECLLLPSFAVVYYVSTSRRAIQASLYFVAWTQIGSFLVICGVCYILLHTGSYNFSDARDFKFSNTEIYLLYSLFFLGFGIKVPVWPFHFWLTKTHVEASAGFSMYLSGFLVKTALIGFYRYSNIFGGGIDTTFFITICIMGVVDASFKMWSQTDLKKLVAYCTVQEMNLIYLTFCWGDHLMVFGGINFAFAHAFLSSLMFFIVDCVQKRYNTRSVVAISGILHTTPNLGIAIFLMCVVYAGVPGTVKFACEFIILANLFNISPFLAISLLIINTLGIIGFCKCWFNVMFGMSNKYADASITDLSTMELLVIFVCLFFSVFYILFPLVF